MSGTDADSNEQRECESHADCQLPDTGQDGHEYVCDSCGRVWEYDHGWFKPTYRYVDPDETDGESS